MSSVPSLISRSLSFGCLAWLLSVQTLPGLTIHQDPAVSYVAFEGEATDAIVAGTPESWVSTNDVAASGGSALYAGGENSTGNSPHSFAQYRIRFRTAGTYRLYSRWKADPARTGGDVFTANSSWFPLTFGAFTTPGDQAPFYTSASNGAQAPADNVFAWTEETAAEYVVTQGEVDAGTLLVFNIGTREAGMVIDRWVFHPTTGLSAAQLDALGNSATDVVIQDAGQVHVGFEAEEPKAGIVAGTPESWVSTNDVAASGGSALYAGGENSTGNSPHSFAQYRIRFRTAGTYRLYSRWKADPARTGGDVFTANSSWFPLTFGAFTTPGDQAPFYTSASNGAQAPADNVFAWTEETAAEYVVTQGEVDAGTLLVFNIGTREAGMVIDRWVFHPTTGLSAAQLDALGNSGVPAQKPQVARAYGSASLTVATVEFTRPIDPASLAPGDFVFDPALNVSAASLDPTDARVVILATAVQTAGVAYTIAISGVTDDGGAGVDPGTVAAFTAWKIAPGWVLKEVFYNIQGTTIQEFKDSQKYIDNKPDVVQWIRGFAVNNEPLLDNYGMRLTALYTPTQSGVHEFYLTDDDTAELLLSTDATAANLTSLGEFPITAPPFSVGGLTTSQGSLTAGKSYLLQGLLKQVGGDAYLSVAAAPSGSVSDPAALTPLQAAAIGAYINPDLGAITFLESTTNLTVPAGSRARFAVEVGTSQSPVYYQWRVNGTPIVGATRPAYTTPVLTTVDSGKSYDVVVSVAGTDTTNNPALLTVTPGDPSNLQPYIGVNFVGGAGGGPAPLHPVDVAGVVPQENWNNVAGTTFDLLPLNDAAGTATPVTLTILPTLSQTFEVWYSGTLAVGDADGALLHGFLSAQSSFEPVTLEFSNVPAGTYQVLVYSMGFDFSASYEQAYTVTGAGTYPTYHGKAETGLNYITNPAYRRMTSTSMASPDAGNYVQFDDVSPAQGGALTVSVAWESINTGNTHQPALNGVQLVRVLPQTVRPTIGVATGPEGITLSWPAAATGFTLEHATSLGAGSTWTATPGAANPLTGAGTLEVPANGAASYYRLRK